LKVSSKSYIGNTVELVPFQLEVFAAVILAILLMNAIWREFKSPVVWACKQADITAL